jgi:hypothetical protein
MGKSNHKVIGIPVPDKGEIKSNPAVFFDEMFEELVIKKIEAQNKKEKEQRAEQMEEKQIEITALKHQWNDLCNIYLEAFCSKHGYDIEEDCWVADDPGTIAMISDMFVSMDNIRYDVDNNIPEETYEEWYWKSLEVYELTEQNYMNYESFCKGAPDIWTDERLKSIKEAKFRVEEAKKALDEEINRYKEEELPEEF